MARARLNICKSLGVSEHLLKILRQDAQESPGLKGSVHHRQQEHSWRDSTSKTDCQKLSLARALTVNPDVLCLHKPTSNFDEYTARRVLALLRKFVSSRGIANDGGRGNLQQ